MSEILTTEVVTAATQEPLSILEAKNHCNFPESDITQDDTFCQLIHDARDQFERDTDLILCTQTLRVRTREIHDRMRLPKRPVQSIVSIQYYDTANNLQTLPSTVYDFDTATSRIYLKYDQVWPSSVDRWDAWTITFIAGYSNGGDSVPAAAKRAMLQLIGYYFDGNRGDSDGANDMKSYENLVMKFARSSYP